MDKQLFDNKINKLKYLDTLYFVKYISKLIKLFQKQVFINFKTIYNYKVTGN